MCAVRTRPALTDKQRAAVRAKLGEVLIPIPDMPAYVRYAEGWDDARVAREVIPDHKGNGLRLVAKHRAERFGYLRA